MHKIYEDGGVFNLTYVLPQICYSFIISKVINFFVEFLALPENDLIILKQENNYLRAKKKLPENKMKLKIKLALYFILEFILLIFFWSYLVCFGSIYKNTQIYLLKDTVISFGLSLVYPLVINLIPAALRVVSLKHPEYVYKLSNLLQY